MMKKSIKTIRNKMASAFLLGICLCLTSIPVAASSARADAKIAGTVESQFHAASSSVKRLDFLDKDLILATKEKKVLQVVPKPIGVDVKQLIWTSSNKKVVQIKNPSNWSCTLVAKKTGKSVITVRSLNGKKATCKVTVKKPYVELLDDELTIEEGDEDEIMIFKTVPEFDTVKSYKSADKRIATVDREGIVYAKSIGETTVTVTMKSGAKASVTIIVEPEDDWDDWDDDDDDWDDDDWDDDDWDDDDWDDDWE